MKQVVALLFAVTACAANSPVWEKMSPTERQAALDTIADQCKLARTAFQLRNNDELHLQPDRKASFESVNCALGKLKTLRGFDKMGFVGNEVYSPEKK